MKPRLLFLSQCLPHPPDAGVTRRTYYILDQLRKSFDITLIAFSREAHQPGPRAREEAAAALRNMVADVADPIRLGVERSLLHRAWAHMMSLVTDRVYTYYEYGSRHFLRQLRVRIESTRYDLVHIDSFDLVRWLTELPAAPVACTHHNIESQLLFRTARQARPRPLRSYMRHQARLMEAAERAWCPRFDLNVVTSPVDAARLQEIAPGSRTLTVPNGVDTRALVPGSGMTVEGRVLFIGGTYSFPNRDGVDFFLSEIWPTVRDARPGANLHIVGRGSVADQRRFGAQPGVACLGFVDDIRSELADASCSVVPLRVGGGTRLKILDAWAMGKAVVSTTVGCEGLEARDGDNILIRDDAQEFARAVLRVLEDEDLRRHLGSNARRIAVDQYSWDVIGRGLLEAYSRLAPSDPDRP